MSKDTKPSSRPVRFPAPDPSMKTRHLIVARPVAPQVAQMLADVYEILGAQIGRMRLRATVSELDGKEAITLHRYALTLTLLRQEEEKRTEQYGLEGYSDEEIQKLVNKSKALLGNNKDNDADT